MVILGTATSKVVDMVHRLLVIVCSSDIDYAELQGAIISMTIGWWWFIHGDAAEPFAVVVMGIIPIYLWGGILVLHGLYQTWGLLYGGVRHRKTAAFMAFLLWVFLLVAFTMTNYRMFAVPVAGIFAIGAGWGYIRTGRRLNGHHNNYTKPVR